MKESNKLVFINHSLHIGGIETWIVKQIKIAIKNGLEVVWLLNGSGYVEDGWKEYISKNVKIVPIKRKSRFKVAFDKDAFNSDDVITAVSFGMVDYYHLLLFKKELPELDIRCYYMIPHFRNPRYYYEDLFRKNSIQYKIVKHLTRRLYRLCNEQGALLFFSQRHVNEIESRYQIRLYEASKRTDKPSEAIKPFDINQAKERAKRKPFTIITCGRFEFPHKGYMFGLIKAYADLKKKYPDIRLIIIGYGEGEKQLKDFVSKLPDDAQEDIIFTGSVMPEELNKYFDMAHVNISVAGGVIAGAKTGLVSIPARHYCYDCEVYGYLSESKRCSLSDAPGENVDKYLNELIEMDDEHYIELCRLSHGTYYVPDSQVNEMWLYQFTNKEFDVHKFIRFYGAAEMLINGFVKINNLIKKNK